MLGNYERSGYFESVSYTHLDVYKRQGELWGIADRTDYDLTRHQEHSGKDLSYLDQEENRKYIPYVIEPSLGADRVALAFLCDALDDMKTTVKTFWICMLLMLTCSISGKAIDLVNEFLECFVYTII